MDPITSKAQKQPDSVDVRLIFHEQIANINKMTTAMLDTFNLVYAEAMKLQVENSQLKEDLQKRSASPATYL
jgi:regulator of replication initiation timing